MGPVGDDGTRNITECDSDMSVGGFPDVADRAGTGTGNPAGWTNAVYSLTYEQVNPKACLAYTQFKFNLDPAGDNTGLRDWGRANSVQLAEIDFYSVTNEMLTVASASNPGGNNPG